MRQDSKEFSNFVHTWTTAEARGDADAIGELLADDFRAVGPLGFTLSKADWQERHRSGALTYRKFEFEAQQVQEHGSVTVVIGRHDAAGDYRGNPLPESLRMTFVVTGAPGRPRLATVHMSFIAGTPGAPPIPGRPAPND